MRFRLDCKLILFGKLRSGANDFKGSYCWAMTELLNTNDAVLISFATALLKSEGIEYVVFDANMSIVEGSIGILPRRLMVDPDRIGEARQLMSEAGVFQC